MQGLFFFGISGVVIIKGSPRKERQVPCRSMWNSFFLFNFTSSSLLVLVNCLFALGEDLLWLALLNRSCSIFQEL